MNIGIRYAARSDVGMLREGNEDSAYAGSHLLAVADGMGGHVGGEIASAAAIGELKKLDADLPAGELLAALEHTVKAANEKLHRIVESDPALQGMGTTLTAMLWSGSQVALVHIGDSRAYLLRDGSLFQITHDHTLVQSLVDEGRISPDEAASHPQRSLLLRALDGRGEVDPDLSLRDAKVGDRYLLCSDGLSGVVTAETIFQVLSEYADPEAAIRQLIDLANRGGGPDNITCVVADVIDLSAGPPFAGRPMAVGAAANEPRTDGADRPAPGAAAAPAGPADTPAGRAAQLRDTMPQPPVVVDEMPPPAPAPAAAPQTAAPAAARPRRRWTWLVVVLAVFVLLLGGGAFAAAQSIRSGYYIGAEDGQVVVYRGSPEGVLGISLSQKAAAKDQPQPTLPVADLPEAQQRKVRETYQISGPDGWKALAATACKYTIAEDGGKVFIFRGRGQDNCKITKMSDGRLAVAQLPTTVSPEQIQRGIPAAGLDDARKQLAGFARNAELCESKSPQARDCPPQRGGKP